MRSVGHTFDCGAALLPNARRIFGRMEFHVRPQVPAVLLRLRVHDRAYFSSIKTRPGLRAFGIKLGFQRSCIEGTDVAVGKFCNLPNAINGQQRAFPYDDAGGYSSDVGGSNGFLLRLFAPIGGGLRFVALSSR
jgi:hypothetical protein